MIYAEPKYKLIVITGVNGVVQIRYLFIIIMLII